MPEQENKTPLQCCTDQILLVVLAILSLGAAISMGTVLGWMTGVSESPVGHAAISGVFGIIGALGAVKALQGPSAGRVGVLGGICVALAISAFCWFFYIGLINGAARRNQQVLYKRTSDIIGKRWRDIDDRDVVAEVNAFRLKARRAGVKSSDYETVMIEVVRPIIIEGKPGTLARLRRVLAIMDDALSTPKAETGRPTKAEPGKEPTEPAVKEPAPDKAD